jgi:hypothetical protein
MAQVVTRPDTLRRSANIDIPDTTSMVDDCVLTSWELTLAKRGPAKCIPARRFGRDRIVAPESAENEIAMLPVLEFGLVAKRYLRAPSLPHVMEKRWSHFATMRKLAGQCSLPPPRCR